MTWNYRILKKHDKETEIDEYFLVEVFYEKDGTVMAYSENETIIGASPQEIIDVLEIMLTDAKKDRPVLTEEDFCVKK